jgi:hypothetical protein
MQSLNIFKKTPHGTCGEWHTVIWGTAEECLQIAEENYGDYLWAWKD